MHLITIHLWAIWRRGRNHCALHWSILWFLALHRSLRECVCVCVCVLVCGLCVSSQTCQPICFICLCVSSYCHRCVRILLLMWRHNAVYVLCVFIMLHRYYAPGRAPTCQPLWLCVCACVCVCVCVSLLRLVSLSFVSNRWLICSLTLSTLSHWHKLVVILSEIVAKAKLIYTYI